MTDTTAGVGQGASPTRPGAFERFVERVAKRMLPADLDGSLDVTVPSGRTYRVGSAGASLCAGLRIRSWKLLGRAISRGGNGFAESYIRGEVESPDLVALIRFFARNKHALVKAGGRLFTSRQLDRLQHLRRRNTKAGSRKNISDHYDLGNEFYSKWLDPSMTYSSALFGNEDLSLELAQDRKYEAVRQALNLKSGAKVLEIGCGWGGFARHLLQNSDACVDGITLSREQLAYAREHTPAGRANFRYEDYRSTTGLYDGIASIEMIEAVGEEHWPAYFATLCERLKPGASAAVQAITIGEDHFQGYRRRADFIQRYIFPGGMLPSVPVLERQAVAAGLSFETAAEFPLDYARTLRLWRQNFEEQWETIEPLGFDERFRRTWRYYLAYCEAGFTENLIGVGIYRFTKAEK